MSLFVIYKVPTYKVKLEICKRDEDEILSICEKLKIDNCYHERLFEKDLIKLNIDLDGENISNFKLKFSNYFSVTFKIKLSDSDYLYTTNFNKKDSDNKLIPSHHVVIRNYHCNSLIAKHIFEDFKRKYYLVDDHIIDTSHLGAKGSGHWFRLPNQTKEGKLNTEHKIINGELEDFVLKFIPSDSINLDNLISIVDLNKKKIKKLNLIKLPILENLNTVLEFPDSSIEEKLFYLFDDNYFSNWTKWSNLCFIIYNLKFSFALFNNLSKKCPSKYTYDACVECWNNCKLQTKPFTIGLIYYLARKNNPTEYYKLMSVKHQTNEEVSLVESTVISSRYLELSSDISDYLTSNVKALTIKSPYGSGKTQLLKQIIKDNNFSRILWISYRRTLSSDILGSFSGEGFTSYLDGYFNANRLIIQLESLLQLSNNYENYLDEEYDRVGKYDLVIIDESESILKHFDSPHFKERNRETFRYLEAIIKNSNKLICLDGDLSNRTHSFIKRMNISNYNIINDIKINNKILNLTKNEDFYRKSIYTDLDADKNIVIVSMKSTDCVKYYDDLSKRYPSKKILIYCGNSDDQNKNELNNVLLNWKDANIVIYSPTIEAGVNFDISHFHKIYGIVISGSTSQRAFLQMLSRVRQVEDNTVLIYSGKLKLNPTYFYEYDEVRTCLLQLDNIVTELKYTEINGEVYVKKEVGNYENNFIYNKVEELNKCPYGFLAYLKKICLKKGYEFNILSDIKIEKLIPLSNSLSILEVPNISDNEYFSILTKQSNGEATTLEKIKAERHSLKNLYGVNNLDSDIIKISKEQINNYTAMINLSNLNGYSVFRMDVKINENIVKLNTIKEIILSLGFINSKKEISEIDFTTSVNNLIKENKIFKNPMLAKVLFNLQKNKSLKFMKDEEFSIKSFLGFINTLLKEYCLKISIKQISIYNKITKKQITNN